MSTLKVTNIQDTSGGNSSTSEQIFQGRAKAWINFNGTGTVAIRADFNVSSITDNGTGNYYVNFSNAMSDVNYVTNLSKGSYGSAGVRGYDILFNQETTRARVETRGESGNEQDPPLVCVSIFR